MSCIGDGFDVRSLAVTFRPGVVLGWHHHPWGQLVFARTGVMRVATDAADWLIPATKAIWLPPGVGHQISMRGSVAMRTLYISPGRARDLPPQPTAMEVKPLLAELILHILSLGMLHPGRPEQHRLAGVLIDLLTASAWQDLSLPLPRHARALALARRLQDQPEDRRDLAALAQDVGASVRTLQRLFPRETGLTFEAWRHKARLIHAAAALSSGARVTEAALDCGYQSLGAFIDAFRRQFGVTPGRYARL